MSIVSEKLTKNAAAQGLVQQASPKHMSHVAIKTSNIKAMRDWYLLVFNGKARIDNDAACFINFDAEDHRIALLQLPGLEPAQRKSIGIEHVTFTFAALGELLGNFQRLMALDITPFWCVNHGMSTSMYYADPDGNHIELQVDNHATQALLENWYKRGGFPANGLGTNFDPAVMLDKFCSGIPVSELLEPGSAPGPGCGAPRLI
ncbi:MAG: VOC family protein [Pseudomonadales bacterium]|nr:VOC family protein [Pseudomonadales bacterium]